MNGEGRLPAAPANNIVGRDSSSGDGQRAARLEIVYRPGESVEVRIVAGDEVGEARVRRALAEREVGLCVAFAVWRFAAELNDLTDFDPLVLLPARGRVS